MNIIRLKNKESDLLREIDVWLEDLHYEKVDEGEALFEEYKNQDKESLIYCLSKIIELDGNYYSSWYETEDIVYFYYGGHSDAHTFKWVQTLLNSSDPKRRQEAIDFLK